MNLGDVRAALPDLAPIVPIRPPAPTDGAAPQSGQPVASAVLPKSHDGTVMLPAGKWCKYAGKLITGVTVMVSASSIRSAGHDPNDPDDDDCKLLQEAWEEGLILRFGDGPVPWWLGAALATGGVYAGMRIGARKLERKPLTLVPDESGRPVEPADVPVVPEAKTTAGNVFGFHSTPDINPTINAKKD